MLEQRNSLTDTQIKYTSDEGMLQAPGKGKNQKSVRTGQGLMNGDRLLRAGTQVSSVMPHRGPSFRQFTGCSSTSSLSRTTTI